MRTGFQTRGKALVIALSTVLMISNLPQAHSAIKSGTSCSKPGAKKVSGASTFSCVKSGKKLIWKQASSSPAAPKGPSNFDDLVANYKDISYAAWSKSRATILASSKATPKYKLTIGPKSTLSNPKPETALQLVSRLYPSYDSSPNLNIVAFGYDDRDWAFAIMNSEVPSSSSQWIYLNACSTKETCWGGGMFTEGTRSAVLILTTEVKDNNHTTGTLEAHEYTHAIQQNQMRSVQPWPTSGNWPPTWYLEGQAEFSQHAAIFNNSFDQYTSNRYMVSSELFRDRQIDSKYIQEFFTLDQSSSWFNKYPRWRQYDLGAMFVEVLVALKGPESTMEMWKLEGSGMNFSAAFEKIYGRPFSEALPIMAKAIALELGNS